MELVEIDPIHAEANERGLDLLADDEWPEIPHWLFERPAAVLDQAAFREDIGSVVERDVLQRATDDLLRMAEAVNRGGVDPVDAEVDGMADRGDRRVVVLRSPAVEPFTADGPGAEPDRRDLEVSGAELTLFEAHQ